MTNLPKEIQFESQVNLLQNLKSEKKNSESYRDLAGKLHRSGIAIHLQAFQMRYRTELPLVLKGLNCSIKTGEKVGIVGRTGAGKSSIIQSLIRIYEPEAGSVYQLFGEDALTMNLSVLRRAISIIPQTPFIFKNTVLMNLDPEGLSQKSDVWKALELTGLDTVVKSLPGDLDFFMERPGDIFSIGQKQLFCLSRALLRNSEIILMDEATSNLDQETDEKIQSIIKKEFKGCTVLTIAHRLMTVADYDRILVMEDGLVKEQGHPY